MTTQRIGLVGLGGIGHRHAACVREFSATELVGGVDCDPARREAFSAQFGVKAYATVEELLAEAGPQGVILATPPSAREQAVATLLEGGVDILSEKPLAHTLESARRLAALAAAYPARRVHVGFCHRFTGSAREARRLIREGVLGEVVWMNIVFASNSPEMKERWMSDPALSGGGAAMDNACHALDLFGYIIGNRLSANGFYRRSWPGRGEDSFLIALREEGGALGSLMGSYVASTPRMTWEICGSKATLRFDYAGAGEELCLIHADRTQEIVAVASARNRFLGQLEAWSASLAGELTGLATLEEALAIAVIMEQLKTANAGEASLT